MGPNLSFSFNLLSSDSRLESSLYQDILWLRDNLSRDTAPLAFPFLSAGIDSHPLITYKVIAPEYNKTYTRTAKTRHTCLATGINCG
jgi:hypothetical protein